MVKCRVKTLHSIIDLVFIEHWNANPHSHTHKSYTYSHYLKQTNKLEPTKRNQDHVC